MTELDDARDALASSTDQLAESGVEIDATDTDIVQALHDVPPYRVYEVSLGGRRAVLKLDAHPRGHAAVEGRVQAYVAAETALRVPSVLAVGSNYYLAAWDAAAATATADHDETWCRAAGTALGRLHEETRGDVSAYGAFRVGGRSRGGDQSDGRFDSETGTLAEDLGLDAHETWREAVVTRLDHHRAYLAEKGYADVAEEAMAYVRDCPGAFDGVGDPVCCHGNVLPEHLAVSDGDPAALIDFEHALAAPAAYDYWRTAGPILRGSDDRPRLERAFRDGYESVRPVPESTESHERAYRLLNAVAYTEALFLQKNRDRAERTETAERFRTFVSELIDECRD